MPPRIPIDRDRLRAFCTRNHIHRLSLFGSAIRDDFAPERSDVDVLVEFEPGRTPGFAFFGLVDELSEILGRRVDLHTSGSLGERIRRRIASEAEVQYDAAERP